MKKLKILIGCEYSGVLRTEFEKLGHDAISCDILDTEIEGKHHKGDLLEFMKDKQFDMMVAFPPCTHLTYAAMSSWYKPGRALLRIEAAKFFMQIYESDIKHIAIENPQGIMSKIFRSPDQEIHPYFFGDREMKRTQLWLKNLPKLKYSLSDTLFEQKTATETPKPNYSRINKKTGKLKHRYFTDTIIDNRFKTGKEKSKTFQGIAKAMAEQWSGYILS